MVEKTKPQDLAEVDQGEKIAYFCLSHYSLGTLYLLGFKETSIKAKIQYSALLALAAKGSENILGT